MWDNLDTELLYAELKSENYLNRITSAANPRFLERVVKDSKFDLELVYGVYDIDEHNDLDYFTHVRTALLLLEQSALGGNGSRGYGRIKFLFAKPVMIGRDAYRNGLDAVKAASVWPADDAFEITTDALALDKQTANQWPS